MVIELAANNLAGLQMLPARKTSIENRQAITCEPVGTCGSELTGLCVPGVTVI
jgi:hypothetical protein